MIGLLRGKLIEKRPNAVLLDVGGVGYQVLVPLSTFAALGPLHSEATLLIHTHVREDQFSLFGFVTAREKQCFELLISASGVGPALALKILSGMGIEQLVPAIRKGDLAALVLIPGVGKKTAERIVVELRDKLAAVDVPESGKPATKSQLEKTVADLKRATGEIDGHSVLIATNDRELKALQALGERNYVQFTIQKSKKSQRVGDVSIRLEKADPKHNRYSIELTADDKTTQKKDRTINEPLQFMTSKAKQPYEIVVNDVKKDEIVGYLSIPKVLTGRN